MKYFITFMLAILMIFHLNAQNTTNSKTKAANTAPHSIYPKGAIDNIELSVTIIGSGNPQYNIDRSGPSALVQHNGVKFLVDMGNGTRAQLEQLGFTRRNSPDALLITHHHLDHNEEFIPMVHQKYMSPGEFLVAGPAPIKEMTDYVTKFYKEDLEYRRSNKGQTFDTNNTKATVKELAGENTFSFKDVTISTIQVPHSIYTLAYRFDANGKSIVISGDLSYTPNLAKLALDADILVLDCQIIREGASQNRRARNKKGNSAHASIEEGAKMAAEAGVKTLVITHLSGAAIDEEATKAKIAEQFKGKIIIAEDFLTVSSDGEVFTLQQ
ncbi:MULTISPECIES: MBL fold metallo-hydrolase [unclassified Saccharicrinis]|uniref:MBL fold metallo-hydrolase n=1 Tax=unclassified Saccharicrinis TaxID=2646859 RepID=UPI003D338476